MRILHKAYAKVFGYFWLPCPVCGKEFGGHEHVWTVPLICDDGRATSVCSHECGAKAEELNDAKGRFWPIRITKTMDDIVCSAASNHCWHNTGETLLSDPPKYKQQCCFCGKIRHIAMVQYGDIGKHGKYFPPN